MSQADRKPKRKPKLIERIVKDVTPEGDLILMTRKEEKEWRKKERRRCRSQRRQP